MSAQNRIQQRLGDYRLLDRIGEGGMGVVYLAVASGGEKVALKVLHPAVAGEPTARRRLAREVETMRRVRSPFVAEVIDADLAGGTPFVVTRYVPGRTLDAVVSEEGPLRGDDLARLACGLADALVAVHAAGVVHRDVKPTNVMLLNGSPVVIDFGIAQGPDATRLTLTGMFMGTPGYLSPEVIEGRPSSEASDVHAWGATVAFAATGHPPFGTGPYEAIFYRIVNGQPDLAGAPAPLLPLLASALAREPAHRPQAVSLSAQAAALGPADLTGGPATGPGAGPAQSTRSDLRTGPDLPAGAPAASARLGAAGPGAPELGAGPPIAAPGVTLSAAQPGGAVAVTAVDGVVQARSAPPPTRPFGTGPPGELPDDFADVLPPVEYQPGPAAPGAQPGGALDDLAAGSRRHPLLVSLLVFASVVAGAGASVILPVAGTATVLGLITALRAVELARRRGAQRRLARGARAGDTFLAVVTFPWYLLRSLLASVLLAPAAAVVAAVVGVAAYLAVPGHPLPRALAYAAGAAVAFYGFGPGSGRPRRQLNRFFAAVTGGRVAQVVAVLGMVALAAAAVAAAATWPSFYWPSAVPGGLPFLAKLRHLGLAGQFLPRWQSW